MTENKRLFRISSFAYIDLPLQDAVERLTREGWTAIEIVCEGTHREILDWTDEQIGDMAAFGTERDIRWSVHAPIAGMNPCAGKEDLRKRSSELLVRTIRIAERLGRCSVVLHAGETDTEEDIHDSVHEKAALERCVSFLEQTIRDTEDSGVMLALENTPPYPGRYGDDMRFIVEVVERIASPRLKIVFDVGHSHIRGPGQCIDALHRCRPHLAGLHLNDNYGREDEHRAVGDGTIPYEEIVRLLGNFGFSGDWVIEACSIGYAEASVDPLFQLRSRHALLSQ